MKKRDIIDFVIDRFMAHDDSITEELAMTVQREARLEWGGQRIPYVAKNIDKRKPTKLGRENEQAAVQQTLSSPQTMPEVAASLGVSRRTLYRALKRA